MLNSLKTSTTSSKKATNHYTKLGNGTNSWDAPTQALTAIQTMADHSQKWHDGTSSKNISSNRPHLDKECPLNEEVKQVEEVKYGEFGGPAPFNGSNRAKFCVGPPGYYTRTYNRPPYEEKRPSLEELMIKHQEESA
ncbi:hypothetical protein Tco_1552860 [Tanacetum coccineum]